MGEYHESQWQGRGAQVGASGYVIPMDDDIWAASRGGPGRYPAAMARGSVWRARGGEEHTLPAEERFWAKPGAGYQFVTAMALAHVGVGIVVAVVGVLAWSLGASLAAAPVTAIILGAVVPLAGSLAFGLARMRGPRAVMAARALPPTADLLTACVLLWLMGNQPLVLLFFVAAPCVAALLFSWRGGAVVAAVGMVCYAGMNAVRPGMPLEVWAPAALALAGVTTLLLFGMGAYTAMLESVHAALRREIATLRQEREARTVEQRRLLETLNLLEDAQARLEHERVRVNQQIVEVANALQRMAQGDRAAAHALQPGMFGPLEAVRMAVERLGTQLAELDARTHFATQTQRLLETLSVAEREQTQLLVETEVALRELGSSANRLVAEIQIVERGSGELPGIDRRQLFQLMRGMEQRALAQASHTTLLGTRLLRLRTRQGELEGGLRQLLHAMAAPADWERSGLYHGPAGVQSGAGGFGSSGVLPVESLPAQTNESNGSPGETGHNARETR